MTSQTFSYHNFNASEADGLKIRSLLQVLHLDQEDLNLQEFKVCKLGHELIAIGRIRQHDDCLELCSLGVDELHRGKGVGKLLIKALLSEQHQDVYVVTEIPGYFQEQGFKITDKVWTSLLLKQKRCVDQLACQKPVIMIRQ